MNFRDWFGGPPTTDSQDGEIIYGETQSQPRQDSARQKTQKPEQSPRSAQRQAEMNDSHETPKPAQSEDVFDDSYDVKLARPRGSEKQSESRRTDFDPTAAKPDKAEQLKRSPKTVFDKALDIMPSALDGFTVKFCVTYEDGKKQYVGYDDMSKALHGQIPDPRAKFEYIMRYPMAVFYTRKGKPDTESISSDVNYLTELLVDWFMHECYDRECAIQRMMAALAGKPETFCLTPLPPNWRQIKPDLQSHAANTSEPQAQQSTTPPAATATAEPTPAPTQAQPAPAAPTTQVAPSAPAANPTATPSATATPTSAQVAPAPDQPAPAPASPAPAPAEAALTQFGQKLDFLQQTINSSLKAQRNESRQLQSAILTLTQTLASLNQRPATPDPILQAPPQNPTPSPDPTVDPDPSAQSQQQSAPQAPSDTNSEHHGYGHFGCR